MPIYPLVKPTTGDSRSGVVRETSIVGQMADKLNGLCVDVVADFGAVGDGFTDDTAAIQLAIDTIEASGGGIVYFPPGTYLVTNSFSGGGYDTCLSAKTGVRLTGAGDASIINLATAGVVNVITADGITDFEIDHLHVIGPSQTETDARIGINVTNACSNGSVHHNLVENNWLGIVVGEVPGAVGSDDISVCDNVVNDSGNNAIGVNSFGSGIRVDRNRLDNFGTKTAQGFNPHIAAGIEIRAATQGTCRGNIITNGDYGATNDVDGIRIEYAPEGATQQVSGYVFTGNVIRNVSGHGIRDLYNKENIITHNTIDACGGHGLLLQSSAGFLCIDNTYAHNVITSPGLNGIYLLGDGGNFVMRNDISHNQIINAGERGMVNVLAYENTYIGNRIYNAAGSGIVHISGGKNTYIGCIVRNCNTITGEAGAIYVVAGDLPRFIDCESYDTRGGSASQDYGIFIEAAVTNPFVLGGMYWPNVTGAVADGAGGHYLQVVATSAASALGTIDRVVKLTDAAGNVTGYIPVYDGFSP